MYNKSGRWNLKCFIDCVPKGTLHPAAYTGSVPEYYGNKRFGVNTDVTILFEM
jgi:hypothetical protein